MYFSDEIIRVCENCYGQEPCLCDNKKKYIYMEKWIYDLMKQLKPV